MSDQDREKHIKATDEDSTEDVEAHKHGGKDSMEKDDDTEDVEAHHMSSRGANDDGSADVEAHKHGGKDT